VIDKRELLVSQKRCAAIADVLSAVSSLGASLHKSEATVGELAAAFGAHNVLVGESSFECDLPALGRCVGALRQAIGPWSATLGPDSQGGMHLAIRGAGAKVPDRYHDSVSSYVSERQAGDLAVLMSAAVDMIIRGHGWSASCCAVEGQCEVLIKIPQACVASCNRTLENVGNG
jgi:hypothetical protein